MDMYGDKDIFLPPYGHGMSSDIRQHKTDLEYKI